MRVRGRNIGSTSGISFRTPAERKPSKRDRVVRHDRFRVALLTREIAKVHKASAGERNSTLFRSAAALGNWCPVLLGEREATTELSKAALAIGLSYQEAEATIRSGLQTGMRSPKIYPQHNTFHRHSSL